MQMKKKQTNKLNFANQTIEFKPWLKIRIN